MVRSTVVLREANNGGRNHWVWLLGLQFDQAIKSVDHGGSRIKKCIKARSSDQEPNLTIKTFDRRRRS